MSADKLRTAAALMRERAEACNCYPGGFPPDAVEGPQPNCPIQCERGSEVDALTEVERRVIALIQEPGNHYAADTLRIVREVAAQISSTSGQPAGKSEGLDDAGPVPRRYGPRHQTPAQQPPDPLAERVEGLAAEWSTNVLPTMPMWFYGDKLRALLAREQRGDDA